MFAAIHDPKLVRTKLKELWDLELFNQLMTCLNNHVDLARSTASVQSWCKSTQAWPY